MFTIEPFYPGGLRYETDFILPDEENTLLEVIRRLPLHPFQYALVKRETGNVNRSHHSPFTTPKTKETVYETSSKHYCRDEGPLSPEKIMGGV